MQRGRKRKWPMMTKAAVKTMFEYHPDGYLVWKLDKYPAKKVRAGQRVGFHDGRGGYRVSVFGVRYNVRDLVWIYHCGVIPQCGIHNGNYDPADNRIENIFRNEPEVSFL